MGVMVPFFIIEVDYCVDYLWVCVSFDKVILEFLKWGIEVLGGACNEVVECFVLI